MDIINANYHPLAHALEKFKKDNKIENDADLSKLLSGWLAGYAWDVAGERGLATHISSVEDELIPEMVVWCMTKADYEELKG